MKSTDEQKISPHTGQTPHQQPHRSPSIGAGVTSGQNRTARMGEVLARSAALNLQTENTQASGILRKAVNPNRSILPDVYRSWEETTAKFRNAFRKCANGESPWPMFAYGDAGAGKTLGALAACDNTHGVCRYTTLYDLHDEVVRLKTDEVYNSLGYRVHPADYWKRWKNADLAVLDELGAREKVSDTLYEAIWQLLESRKGGKPLIVISNLSLQRLGAAFDDRIASRCSEGTVVKLDGDRRLKR